MSEGLELSEKESRRAVVVLGMHRSGTSLMSALLCTAGLAAPKHLMQGDSSNETGHWEPARLYRLSDELLDELGSRWDSTLSLPPSLLRSPAAHAYQERFAQLLRDEYPDARPFCLKEPRGCRLLPLWAPVFEREGIAASYVVIARNPLEVAESLKARDGMHWSESLLLWLRYTLEAELHTRGKPRVFVTYDQLMTDWRAVLARVGSELDIAWTRRGAEIDIDFDEIIADRLRHGRIGIERLEARKDLADWYVRASRAIIEAAEGDASRLPAALDAIRTQLTAAETVFEPQLLLERHRARRTQERLEEELSEAAEHAARIDSLEAQLEHARERETTARGAAADLVEQLAGMRLGFDERGARIGELEAELSVARAVAGEHREASKALEERLRHELAGVSAERDERGVTVEELKLQLAGASAERDERGVTVEELKLQLAAASAESDARAARAVELERQLAELSESMLGVRAESDARAARAAELERHLAELSESMRGMRAESDDRAARAAELERQRAELDRQVAELSESMRGVRAESDERAARAAELERAAAEALADAQRARRIMEQRNAQIRELRKALEIGDAQLRRDRELAQERFAPLEAELRENRAALVSAEGRVAALSATIAGLRAELALSAEERAETEADRATLVADAQAARSELAERARRVELLEARVRTLVDRDAESQTALDLERRTVAALRAQLAELETAVDAARAATHAAELAPREVRHEEAAVAIAEPALPPRRKPPSGPCDIALWRVDAAAVSTGGAPAGPIGVFAHIYYEEIAPEIAAALKNIPYPFVAYVSTANEFKKSVIELAFAREGIANVVVKILPNAGRDIGPFIFGFAQEVRKHEICLRLHSKKSTHSDDARFGTDWRRFLISELIGDVERAKFAVGAFVGRADLGMLIPAYWRGIDPQWLGIADNWEPLRTLLDAIGVSIDTDEPIEYPCGSMFWFRSAALEPLLSLDLQPEDFAEASEENRDATLAHGFERVFLYSAAKAGMTWAFLPSREAPEPELEAAIEIVRESGAFDAQYYLEQNPDVAEAGDDPLEHFMRYGHLEYRNPSADFDCRFYAKIARRDGGWSGNPVVHYVLYGRAKGLATKPARRDATPVITMTNDLYAPYKRAELGADYVPEAFPLLRDSSVKIMAFYFPQFHPFAENDRFWGRGFTEWTNTTKAVPLYPGHYQPRLPGELGFYDTRVKEVLARQIELAKQYGVYGFCFHHYFFQGKPVMRAPFDHIVANKDLDVPFCLHWANEPWTVRWDGLASQSGMLLDQRHEAADDYAFFEDIAPALTDPRYITIDGRPLVVIYRPGLFPDVRATIERWRECCRKIGLKDLYLAVMQAWFEGAVDPRKYGFDAAIEYPPHNLKLNEVSQAVNLYDPQFAGSVRNYAEAVSESIARPVPDYTWFRGIMADWDCTPRRADPDLFINSSPARYRQWLEELCRYTERTLPADRRLLFINSWNEWAEGAYVEPDRRYGYAYLDATARALNEYPRSTPPRESPSILVATHLFYDDLLDEFLGHYERIPSAFDLFLTVSHPNPESIAQRVRTRLGEKARNVTVRRVENVGRDGAPFLLHALPESQRYDLCCWTHSKKSPYDAAYAPWRGYLLENLLGSSGEIEAVLETFERDATLGIAYPAPFPPVADKVEWGSNFAVTSELLARLGISVREDEAPDFPPGMMFWFRPAALRPLLDLGIRIEDFERQSAGALHASGTVFDGTLSHALERAVLYVAKGAGFSCKEYLNRPFSARGLVRA